MTDPPHRVSIDAALMLIANGRRRAALRVLIEAAPESVATDRLAAELAEPSAADGRLLSSLRHLHLPRLDAAGVVVYDPAENTARYVETEPLERLLRYVDRELPAAPSYPSEVPDDT